MRLRNITLNYRLPRQLLSKLNISSANFYVRGFNLWTKTYDDRLTFDPEVGVNSLANLNIPLNKTVTVGLNLEF